jgi:hypothetical protein
MTVVFRVSALVAPIVLALVSCGGGETPAPKTAEDAPTPERTSNGPAMTASAEIGALDEGKVTQTFHSAMKDLQSCLASGAQRNELEGGSIGFFIKIGSNGRIVHAHAERSTIGDRDTEKCMLAALGRQAWPEPQGGDVGLAHNSFDFDMPNDARPPTVWEADRVESSVSKLSAKIAHCKHGAHGDFTATVYVDPDGAALSAGIAATDESGEGAADCIVSALKTAKYPSPGSWPAKVSFPL